MSNKSLHASSFLLIAVFACTTHSAGSVAAPPNEASAIAERISFLATALVTSRAKLDSAVLELHRNAGDTAARAIARSLQLRKSTTPLDSAYRANLAEYLWTVSAAPAGVINRTAAFPVDAAPAPLLRGFADGANWMILSPMIHEVGKNSSGVVIVPRGFVTDLASIPAPLQVLRGRPLSKGRFANAAVVHDYLYWRQDCTRAQADNIMAIAMMEAGIPLLERTLIYQGVRQFGQSAWDENRRARQAGLMRTVAPPHDQVPPTGTWDEYREWLRATRANEGLEYRVQESVCAMADSARDRT